MKYGVHVDLQVTGPNLIEAVDAVMEALSDLEDCHEELLDTSVGLDASSGGVEIDVSVTASTRGAALDLAVGSIRSAIHATGGHTPDWDDRDPGTAVAVYRLDEDEGVSVRQIKSDLVSL